MAYLLVGILMIAAVKARSEVADKAAIRIVQKRFVQAILPTDSQEIARLLELAEKDAVTLRAEGTWGDIDYANRDRSEWKTAEHLNRVLFMAEAARIDRDAGHENKNLQDAALRAFTNWLDKDYQNPNWWWNQIGVPKLTGQIACLLGDVLPAKQKQQAIHLMQRSDWKKWTGANLTWGVSVQIIRGCLEENSETIAQGYARMYQEIRIVGPREEGIQADYSFHQHGVQLYNGSYGLSFATDVGQLIAFANSTPWEISHEKMAIFAGYLLDGEQWMMRDGEFDYSVCGRVITRRQDTHDSLHPALARAVELLAAEKSPWQAQLKAFADRMDKKGAPLVGNRQFWCSDYMAHHGSGYFASVKMLSDRMQNGEIVNSEGLRSQHLSDGANFLYIRGDEYQNIFPVWDWSKVPGTTAIATSLKKNSAREVAQRGGSTFAGGVSDGNYGACAMDLARGKIHARKAWFFFDHAYVCLGSGIDCDDASGDVVTDVNQTLLRDEVTVGKGKENDTTLQDGQGPDDRTDIHWVCHDHVTYLFAPGQRVCIWAGDQSGRWSNIGAGLHGLVKLPVFNLWIDHGKNCRNGSYEYTVLPGADRAVDPKLTVLANGATQAVYDPEHGLVEAVFRADGSLKTPVGNLSVDHACMLLAEKTNAGETVYAANPPNQALGLTVQWDDKKVTLQLPGGNRAGASMRAKMQ
jgi:chondroitin AC lyase